MRPRIFYFFILLFLSTQLVAQGSDAFSASAPNILFNPTSGNLSTATKESDCTFGAYMFAGGVTGFSNNYLYHCQYTNSACTSGSTTVVNKTDYADLWYKVTLPSGTSQMTLITTGLATGQVLAFCLYTASPGTVNSTNVVGNAIISATPTNSTASYGGSFLSSAKPSQTILNLTAGGTYYVRIMGAVSSSSSSAAVCGSVPHPSFSIEAQAPQANDICSTAINITTNNAGIAHTGNYNAALSDASDEWTDCTLGSKTAAKDLWYQFNYPSATAGTVFLSELTLTGTAGQAVRIMVYKVTYACGAPVASDVEYCELVNLSSTAYTTQFNNLQSTQSQTRKVQIIPVGTVGNVTVSGKVLAANNSCEWFQNVLPGFTITSTQTANFNYASSSSSFPTESGADLWFKFSPNTATVDGILVASTSATITVSGLTAGQQLTAYLYKGNTLSSANCSNLSSNYLSTVSISANGNYTIRCLDEMHNGALGGYLLRLVQTAGSTASPSIIVTSGAVGVANNKCSYIWNGSGPAILGNSDVTHGYNKYNLLCNPDNNLKTQDGETASGTFSGSNDCESGLNSTSCNGTSNNPADPNNGRDVWYVFRVPQLTCSSGNPAASSVITSMQLTYSASGSSPSTKDVVAYVYSSCDDASLISCSGNLDGAGSSWTIFGLTQGSYYLLRMRPSSLNASYDFDFTVKMDNGIPAPCNDDPTGLYAAAPLTVSSCMQYGELALWNAQGATSTTPVSNAPQKDVWFSFVAPDNGGSITNSKGWVTVFFESVSGHLLSVELFDTPSTQSGSQVYSTSPNIPGSKKWAVFGNLTPGATYYIRLYHSQAGTVDVTYKLAAFSSNMSTENWSCGENSYSNSMSCSSGCNSLDEVWFKIDLPPNTPAFKYWNIRVEGDNQNLDFELRSQWSLGNSSYVPCSQVAESGLYGGCADFDHPCSSSVLESSVSLISQQLITSPCNPGAGPHGGVSRVYYNLNGPVSGSKNYYFLRVFNTNPTGSGVKICNLAFEGPYSSASKAEVALTPDISCNVALPLELISFQGYRTKEGVHLNWATANEQNTESFRVLRSSDGNEFEFIAEVDAAGFSTGMLTYDFTDLSNSSVDFYYQLMMIDRDGQTTSSEIILVRANEQANSVFPNPATNVLFVSGIVEDSFTITSMSGLEVLHGNYNQADGISITDLERGFYLLTIGNRQLRFMKE